MADYSDGTDVLDIFAQCIQVMIMEKWLSLSSIYALSQVNRSLDNVTCASIRRLKYLRSTLRPRFIEKLRDFIMYRKKVCWKNVPVSHITTPISELLCSSRGIRLCVPSSPDKTIPAGSIIHTIMIFTYTNDPIYVTIIINNEPVCGKIINTGICCNSNTLKTIYCRTMRIPEIFAHESVDLSITHWDENESVHSTAMDLEFCIQNISHIRIIYGEYEKHYDFWRQNMDPHRVTPFRAEGLIINGKVQHCTKSLLTYTDFIEKNVIEHLTSFAKKRGKSLPEILRILLNYSIMHYGRTFVDILVEYFSISPCSNIMFLPVCSDQTVLGLRFDLSDAEKTAGGYTEKAAGGYAEKAVLIIPAIHILIDDNPDQDPEQVPPEEEYQLDFPDIDICRVIENLAMRHSADPEFSTKSAEYEKKLKDIHREMSNL